jgi:hypothetical protein
MRSGIVSLGIRAATLFFRFALSFYVISYLGLEAAGVYGLAIGAIGIVPALLGWGLNYFVSRDVVGMTPDGAAPLVRDRLIVTLLSLTLGTLVAIPLIVTQAGGLSDVYILILILLWLETLALDVYMPLVGLEMALQANVLVLVRSALWIPVVVAMGIVAPEFRTLETVFIGWIVSHLLAIALLFVFLRHWPVRAALDKRLDRAGMWMRIRNGWYIYLSDLGLVGLSYADRFILNAMLGLAAPARHGRLDHRAAATGRAGAGVRIGAEHRDLHRDRSDHPLQPAGAVPGRTHAVVADADRGGPARLRRPAQRRVDQRRQGSGLCHHQCRRRDPDAGAQQRRPVGVRIDRRGHLGDLYRAGAVYRACGLSAQPAARRAAAAPVTQRQRGLIRSHAGHGARGRVVVTNRYRSAVTCRTMSGVSRMRMAGIAWNRIGAAVGAHRDGGRR